MKTNQKLLKNEINASKHLMGLSEAKKTEEKEIKTPLTDEAKTYVIEFIKDKKGKQINDSEIHAIADKFKVNPHKLESFIYTEFSKRIEKVNPVKKGNIKESKSGSIDTITMDVPLFIRMLEYAKEDAKTDMDLHVATEKALESLKTKDILTMDSYDYIVGRSKK